MLSVAVTITRNEKCTAKRMRDMLSVCAFGKRTELGIPVVSINQQKFLLKSKTTTRQETFSKNISVLSCTQRPGTGI